MRSLLTLLAISLSFNLMAESAIEVSDPQTNLRLDRVNDGYQMTYTSGGKTKQVERVSILEFERLRNNLFKLGLKNEATTKSGTCQGPSIVVNLKSMKESFSVCARKNPILYHQVKGEVASFSQDLRILK